MQLRAIRFWAQGSQGLWQGAVESQEWLAKVLPQLSTLLPESATDSDALELFSAVARPLEISSELLEYNRLFEFELVESFDFWRFDLPVLSTPQCRLSQWWPS
jgi:type III secretion protein Q